MENKKTSELLDILWKLEKQSETDDNVDWDEYGRASAELEKRPPFNKILGITDDPNDATLEERIDEAEDTIKLLKRHKHDEKNGDVLIRI